MYRPIRFFAGAIAVVAIGFATSARAGDPVQLDNNGMQIDARGPVHEAYAQPWQTNPGPNEPAPKKPPEPIPEQPAAEKPTGTNVQWMPGYWQWDLDRKDFIWVSGFWREVPKDRRWVAGSWAQTAEGYRWVSGHWAAQAEQDYQYVPQPPKNPDTGPTTAQPDANSFYIPGTYFYGENGYTYRNGYWADFVPGQVWVPARYIWTPRGYIFASGYWDYGFDSRGLLFAPVYFASPLWLTPGWYYRPSFVIGLGGMYGSLFVGAGFGHYYFGDFYGSAYIGFGITPWFQFGARFYDPLWVHASWVNRGNVGWAAGLRADYIARVNGTAPLPARTFAAQANSAGPRMVSTFSEARASGVRLEAANAAPFAHPGYSPGMHPGGGRPSGGGRYPHK